MGNKQQVCVVTIDGPAASGKSSVSRGVARALGWKWLSTGAFYRALAYVARRERVPLDSEDQLVRAAQSSIWRVEMAEDRTRVYLGSEDVTDSIYGEAVGADASQISHFPRVRESLLKAQRDCAIGPKGLVAEGRDCGTVVFPQAQVKIYLTARSESRAERRAREEGLSVDATKAAQDLRDRQDTTRKSAPLQIPKGAHVVDTSEMTLDEVIDHVIRLVRADLDSQCKRL